jgi:hypothetical protein
MNKQVKLYKINLGMAKTINEKKLSSLRSYSYKKLKNYKKMLAINVKEELGEKTWTEKCNNKLNEKINNDVMYQVYSNTYEKYKELLSSEYSYNNDMKLYNDGNKDMIIRGINSKNIKDTSTIAIGSNNLVRVLELNLGEFTDKFIEIECGKIDDNIIDNVVHNGLFIDNNYYIFFTAGAGQTRKQKFLMIKEDVWKEKGQTLLCGLTIEKMNEMGGMNINKFLAYLALNNSNSIVWKDFDIDRCIVVPDFETMVNSKVDYISRNDKAEDGTIKYTNKKGKEVIRKKYKVDWSIEKNKVMDVPVPHMDGCGIMLTSINKKNIQFRMPWFKGLLTPTNFKKYAIEEAKNTIVTDIYGKEWNIVKDKIQIIFTASQFKLAKYYSSWQEYKDNFKKYKCTFNICEEDERKYKDKQLNYQMLQTLTDMTDPQVELLCKDFKDFIAKVHSDRDSQLEFLGATKYNEYRDYFQEALRLYPEMLQSDYVNAQIKQIIKKAKKDAKCGKIIIPNTKRVFIIPDVIAFMDWLFTGKENPEGCLKENEVYCDLYKDIDKLDVLRSPHLSFEHAIRNNVATKKKNNKYKYFTTNGIYTSSHDLISKILQFDVDGDHAVVICEKWVIKLVENMIKKYNINPIYYTMGKAPATQINADNIFECLKFVYHKSNIGKVSNALTKIWNGNDPWDNYNIVEKLCAFNNFVIDSAKTLEIPKKPKDVKDMFDKLQQEKYPYFFQFVKDEVKLKDCNKRSNSVMDRICKQIEHIARKDFNYDGFGTFKIDNLLHDRRSKQINYSIVDFYLQLEKETREKINAYATTQKGADEEDSCIGYYKKEYYIEARKRVLEYAKENNLRYDYIVDNIIKYTFEKDNYKMAFLFNVFGANIINNINKNITKSIDEGYVLCADCGKRIKNTNGKTKRCKECAVDINKKKTNINKKKKKIA